MTETLNLLVPLDGTEFSRQIIGQVRRLFAPETCRVNLLHVANPPGSLASSYRPAMVGSDYTLYAWGDGYESAALQEEVAERHALYDTDAAEDYRQQLTGELERELTLFREAGYEVSATVHFGEPVEEITTFAEQEQVSVIAMTTHGRTGLSRLFQGSVAQDVFKQVSVPVLLLRAGDEGEELGAEPVTVQAHDSARGSDERP